MKFVLPTIWCSGVSAQASAQSVEGFHLVQAGRAGGQRLGGQGSQNHQDGVPQQSLKIFEEEKGILLSGEEWANTFVF